MSDCPKCSKPYLRFSFLGEPDEEGICCIIIHSMKRVPSLFGGYQDVIDEKCFLNLEQFNTMYGKPKVKCEDCVGCRNQQAFNDFCMKFNNRPNFRQKKDEDDDGYDDRYETIGGVHDGDY